MTGELGRLIQEHKDEQRYYVSNAAIAAALGVTRTTVGNWIAGDVMPSPENLRKLAHLLVRPYSRVLDAALADAGYLDKEREGRGQQPAATKPAGDDPAEPVIETRVLQPPPEPPSEASPRTAAGPRRRGQP